MKITNVKIRRLFNDPREWVKAIVSVTFDGEFAVHDIKVIDGEERMFLAMPNRRGSDGRYQDIAHPITQETRREIEDAVIKAYQQAVAEAQERENE